MEISKKENKLVQGIGTSKKMQKNPLGQKGKTEPLKNMEQKDHHNKN